MEDNSEVGYTVKNSKTLVSLENRKLKELYYIHTYLVKKIRECEQTIDINDKRNIYDSEQYHDNQYVYDIKDINEKKTIDFLEVMAYEYLQNVFYHKKDELQPHIRRTYSKSREYLDDLLISYTGKMGMIRHIINVWESKDVDKDQDKKKRIIDALKLLHYQMQQVYILIPKTCLCE